MIYAPTNRRIIRPFDKPSFEHTQRYGLIKGHPLGPTGGLVAFWPLNEDSGNRVFDLSGNGNTGTLVADTHWVLGKFGSALDFDGTGDYVDIGDTSVVDFGAGNFSLMAWMKTNDPDGPRQMIIGKDISGQRQFGLVFDADSDVNDRIGVFYFAGGSVASLDSAQNPITDSNWHHIVGQRVGDSFEIYLDGSLLVSGITAGSHGTMDSTTSKLQIGAREYSTARDYFNGTIDDVMIWNRSLSASEIALLYAEPFCMIQKKAAPVYFFVPTGGEVKEIIGAITSVSSVTGGIDVTREITGDITAQCSVTGTLDVSRKIVGVVTAASTVTGGALEVTRELIGAVTVASTVTGSLTVAKLLVSTVTATSTVTGGIDVTRELAGVVTVQCSVTGQLSVAWELVGTITCVSTVAGVLVIPAGNFSDYAEPKILDHIVGKTSYSKPTVSVGLCTADPTDSGTGASCNEVSDANNYGRVVTAPADWNAAASGEIDNANPVTFPEASGPWGAITHYALFDSEVHGGGNMLLHDELDLSKSIVDEEIVNFAAGQLKLVLS